MKLLLIFLLNIIFIKNKDSDSSEAPKEYTTSEIISLIKSCKTKGYKIIDPNDYIKKDDEMILEKQLKDVYKNHKVVSFIIVFQNAYLKDQNNNDIDISNYTQTIVDEIYSQSIVGKNTPIIVAVISIHGKIMTMKAHGSISYTISEQDCINILYIINKYFSHGEYSYGTVELGNLINYYLSHTDFYSRNKRFFFLILLLILSFCFCYVLAWIAQKIKDRRNLRLTMSDEEKLIKMKEFLKKAKTNRKILSDNCIICLEPFDNCKSISRSVSLVSQNHIHKNNNKDNSKDINTNNIYNNDNNINDINHENSIKNNLIKSIDIDDKDIHIEMQNVNDENDNAYDNQRNSNVTDNQISTLPCGHRYHVRCISEWVIQKKKACPMCREKINVDIPEVGAEEDLVNELLSIQIELHPAFALLAFQTINEELTWAAITLPVFDGGLFFGGLGGFALV